MTETIVVERRFRGPTESGNGGYVCGRLAAFVGGPTEVTLRLPPPLDRPLEVRRDAGRVLLYDGDALVAEAAPGLVDVEPPEPPSWAEAVDARTRYTGFAEHEFPECFTCGPAREEGDGLRIYAGSVAGREPLVAAPWQPREEVAPEIVWAAIDCPGAFAANFSERGAVVLGRMAAEVLRVPRAGEPCVVVGWPLGEEGRKLYAGTALFGEGGELLARARQTWILPNPKAA